MKKYQKVLTLIMVFAIILSTNVFAVQIVNVKHNNTKEEIVEIVKKYPHTAFDGQSARYNETPKFTSPYYAGSIDQRDLDDALNAVKVVRYLAGVPYENIKFTDELNNIAQHGAVLMAASNQFTHTPYQPDDMSNDFFKLGYKGCKEANINAGRNNLASAVTGFIFDNGKNNITRVGHRRWILKPGATNFGMGYAQSSNASYNGRRISMYVRDGLAYWECESDSYIAWPAAGDFPIQYFAASNDISDTIVSPWSINLGAQYSEPSKNKVVVKLTRKSDNKVWIFDKNTPDLGTEGLSDTKLHLAVDNDGYGITKAIVFRPDPNTLGTIKDGDVFTVEVSGITNKYGQATTLKYDINFFDLEKEIEKSNSLCGDVNDDNIVDRKDLTRLSQYFARWDVEINKVYADANGDNKVDRKDLTRLSQYFARWNVELGK